MTSLGVDLIPKILEEKKRWNAVILAHNYQPPEVQDVADFVGDSLDLSLKVMEVDADIIVFAGVDFMAEQAKILNPTKIVLLPDRGATCSLARMASRDLVEYAIKKLPNVPLIAYVNSFAEVKALSKYIVTSRNAPEVVEACGSEVVLFTPDANLGKFISQKTAKQVLTVPSCGHCYVHKAIQAEDIDRLKSLYPGACVIVHPECDPEVWQVADFVGSTGQMLRYVKSSSSKVVLVGTERDMCYRIKREAPDREVLPVWRNAVCLGMKRITLDNILRSLRERRFQIEVEPAIAEKIRKILEDTFDLLGMGTKPWRK